MFFRTVVTLVVLQVVNQARSQQCGVPMDPPGQAVSPSQLVGTWYEYLYRTPPVRSNMNTMQTMTAIGHNAGEPFASATRWEVSLYVNNSQPFTCMGIHLMTASTLDGKMIGTGWFPNRVDPSVTYTVLLTDYHTFQLLYRCPTPGRTKAICDNPFFWVNTRVIPTQLDRATLNYIRERVAAALRPYCWNLDQLTVTTWDMNLPACRPSVPEAYSQLVQQITASSSRNAECIPA